MFLNYSVIFLLGISSGISLFSQHFRRQPLGKKSARSKVSLAALVAAPSSSGSGGVNESQIYATCPRNPGPCRVGIPGAEEDPPSRHGVSRSLIFMGSSDMQIV